MALRRLVFGLLALVAFVPAAHAAAADPFTVRGVHVDVTAASPTAARDAAMAQGRPAAWTKLYRSLAPQGSWGKQPRLNDFQLQHIIRSYEVSNERRSNTRYIADVTYVFSPNEVRKLMRGAGAPLAEASSRPALIIPLVGGHYDPNGAWAKAWTDPAVGGLMPMVFPRGEAGDDALIGRGNFGALTWDGVAALAKHYNAVEVVIAEASANGQQAKLTELWAPVGRAVDSIAVARPDFRLTAMTSARKLAESWRQRSAVDTNARLRLIADVEFSSPTEWSRIRARLALVKMVTSFEVNGLSAREARIRLVHYGRAEQLAAALSAQQLELIGSGENYRLRYRAGPSSSQDEAAPPATP